MKNMGPLIMSNKRKGPSESGNGENDEINRISRTKINNVYLDRFIIQKSFNCHITFVRLSHE